MQVWDGRVVALRQGVPARVEAVANDALLGTDSVEADKIEPWTDDATRSLCRDLVVRSLGPGTPGCMAPSGGVLSPRFLSAMDLGTAGLGLPGSSGSPFPPIN
jgi:hypothetical protein